MPIFTYSWKGEVQLPSFPRAQQVGATATCASSCRRGPVAFSCMSQPFLLSPLRFHDWVVAFLKEKQPPKKVTTNSAMLPVVFSLWGQPENPWGLYIGPKNPEVFNFQLQSSALQAHTHKKKNPRTQQENFEPVCSFLHRSGDHHLKYS